MFNLFDAIKEKKGNMFNEPFNFTSNGSIAPLPTLRGTGLVYILTTVDSNPIVL